MLLVLWPHFKDRKSRETKQTQVKPNENRGWPIKPVNHIKPQLNRFCPKSFWTTTSQNADGAPPYRGFQRYHTQNTASAPSHPIQHPTAGMGTHMTPVGCVMAGCCQINYILTNIGRRNPIRILNQHPLFWNILIWTEFICFINLFAFWK